MHNMKILLADDHPLFREGVKAILLHLGEAVSVIEAKDYHAAFNLAQQHPDLDLVLLDLYMPGAAEAGVHDTTRGIGHFRQRFPELPLVVLSAAENPDDIQRLLVLGVAGYITKSSPSEVILGALRLVLAGGVYVPPALMSLTRPTADRVIHEHGPEGLTERQLAVLRELTKGSTNKQIARDLRITEGTVKVHISAILKALKVGSRTEALLVAQKMGFGG